MERLTSACGAQRLMLRADGLLCVEGSRATVERLAEQLHELYKDPGADSGEEEVFSQPGEAGEASEATVRLAGVPGDGADGQQNGMRVCRRGGGSRVVRRRPRCRRRATGAPRDRDRRDPRHELFKYSSVKVCRKLARSNGVPGKKATGLVSAGPLEPLPPNRGALSHARLRRKQCRGTRES
eukprot:g1261.t1